VATVPGEHDLDVRGLVCPMPVLLAQRALDALPPGGRVTAIGDDPAIHGDVPAWCEEAGHRLVELVELGGDEIRFVVEKAAGAAAGPK
jgi:tRNA 2-thiouridine synthesizing protein A